MFYPYVFHRERYALSVNPLTAQPIVEACLRIPTYVLLCGGVSRGLARKAFADVLPEPVAKRTVKGLPSAFFQQILRRNMAFVRERLIDGLLVKERILDREKLEAYLVADQPFLTVQPAQILCYLACEAWLSQWQDIMARSDA
jgi:asparagine synthase (glutamine-hydrolysing)